MKKSEIEFWQIVWFLSWPENQQESFIGKTDDQWFIEEDESNFGANYLKGLCFVFRDADRPDNQIANELHDLVSKISQELNPAYWCFKVLSRSTEWNTVRILASRLLEEESPIIAPPRKAFIIENMLHVEHHQHASKIRKQLMGNKKSRR